MWYTTNHGGDGISLDGPFWYRLTQNKRRYGREEGKKSTRRRLKQGRRIFFYGSANHYLTLSLSAAAVILTELTSVTVKVKTFLFSLFPKQWVRKGRGKSYLGFGHLRSR